MEHLGTKRRGIVLFVVMVMLSLLTVLSVTLLYSAGLEHFIAQARLEQQQQIRPDPDALLAYALRMLVFDEPGYGPFGSHIGAHGLLRNMFGSEGLQPFCGTGRFHGPDYSYYGNNTQYYDHFYATCYIGRSYSPAQDGTLHPPYTFPDMTHVFLGHLETDQQTGQLVVTAQSFVRRSLPRDPEPTGSQVYFDPYDPANLDFWDKPNWNNNMPVALRKALVFRPLPLEHPRFPPPADIGGDVRNLPPGIPVKLPNGQLHYGNDSIWMDLDFPVQVGPDGRAYKPLFAFFITDLDGRLDLNRLSWNPQQVTLAGENVPAGYYRPAEAEYLLRHADTNADSFTSLLFPLLPNTLKDIRRRHMLTVRSSDLPYAGFVPQVYRNPWDDTSPQQERPNVISYPNTNPDEGPRWTAYPMQYRVLWPWQGSTAQPPGANRKPIQSTNDVNQGDFVLKNVNGNWEWTGRITREVNRYDPSGQVIQTAQFPSLQRLNLVQRIQSLPPYPTAVDLDNDPPDGPAKSQLAQAIAQRQTLAREIYFRLLYACGLLDENPAPISVSAPAWFKNVYPNLPASVPYWPPTGVRARVPNPVNPTDEELKPLRYLAQLAVNIVDYFDTDNYSTPFMFYTDMDGYPLDDPSRGCTAPAPNLRYWVFGTERPRIVLNEALFEFQEPFDANNNTRVDGPFDMRCWIELFNTAGVPEILGPDDPTNPARKVTVPRYKVQVIAARNENNVVDVIAGAANGDNVLGELTPDDLRAQTNGDDLLQSPVPPRLPWQLPWNNSPYLLLGPNGDTADSTLSDPNHTPPNWIKTDNLKFGLELIVVEPKEEKSQKPKEEIWVFRDTKNNTHIDKHILYFPDGSKKVKKEAAYLVLLRRLAYPQMNDLTQPQTLSVYQDPQLGTTLPDYEPTKNPLIVNPYITLDTMLVRQGQGLCDRTVDNQGRPTGSSVSWARTNPYADTQNKLHNQQDPNPLQVNGQATNSWHSLGKPNPQLVPDDPMLVPRPWPKHADGPPTTLMDILQVSAFKTHLLTRRYRNSNYPEYHYAPWFDDSARIQRVLEFFEVRSQAVGVSPLRVQGKVNLNTANAGEILAALSEWQAASGQNIAQKWLDWVNARQARGPVYGFAPGNTAPSNPPLPLGLNGEHSWWRIRSPVGASNPVLLDDSQTLPLQEHAALFGHLYDRLTTRSNVFAVWCTVGFFEADPNTGQLGPEIGADTGQQLRYRFFAIIDRTIIAEWMLQNNKPVETQLGRTDIDPRKPGPNGEPPCVIYWSRIQ